MAYVPKKSSKPSASDTSHRRPLDQFPPLCEKPIQELNAPRPGQYVVLKFGGSSLKDPDRLAMAVDTIVMEHAKLGHGEQLDRDVQSQENGSATHMAVVVSAMGGTTDLLIDAATLASHGDVDGAYTLVDQIAKMCVVNVAVAGDLPAAMEGLLTALRQLLLGMSLVREMTPQMLDAVLSFGERLSASTMRELLEHRGLRAVFVDAREWLITDATFGQAKIDRDATYKQVLCSRETWDDAIAVVTGFIGRTHDDRTTTLGRNGSDYTAAVLGAALKADRVVINTDVAGVMTADPTIVKHAYPVQRMCYDEALELAVYGDRLFHPRTMLPLIETGVPMIIRKTSSPNGTSTLITAADDEFNGNKPTCVASLERLALLEMRSNKLQETESRLVGRVVNCLTHAKIATFNTTESAHGQSVHILVKHMHAMKAVREIEKELRVEIADKEVDPVDVIAPVTLLSLVQRAGRRTHSAADKFFGALGARNINILGVSNSERALSCIIHARDTAKAVTAVHDAFNFAHQRLSMMLLSKKNDPCWNGVARTLVQMIQDQAGSLRSMNNVEITVVGVATSEIVFNPSGISPAEVAAALVDKDGGPPASASAATPEFTDEFLDNFANLPVPVIVDCSALLREDLYQRALSRGIHIVCSNVHSIAHLSTAITSKLPCRVCVAKPPSTAVYPGLLACDASVGTSLPILDTFRRILKTGDVPLKTEASLSGSVGFICHRINHGASLRDAVEEAFNRSIMEANPWDDLLGRDVERKLRVIGICLGILELDSSQLSVEGLVPESLEAKYPWEETGLAGLLAAMEEYEPKFRELYPQTCHSEQRLRFVSTIHFSYKPTCDARNPQSADPVSRTGSRFSSLYDVKMQARCAFVSRSHPLFSLSSNQICVAMTSERYRHSPLSLKGSGAGSADGAAGVLNDIITLAHALKG